MKKELVNLHAGLCTLWVDHPHLEPEIPQNSFALISPIKSFVGDGIYVLQIGNRTIVGMCVGLSKIVFLQSLGSRTHIDMEEFSQIAIGKVVSSPEKWL